MRILMTLILGLFLAAPAMAAGFQDSSAGAGAGGFQGPSAQGNISTVAKAKSAMDESWVVLVGHIVSRAGGDHEHYIFRDGTGEITVDIDDKLFMGRTVTPQTRVRIHGEVDREMLERTKIDVKRFEILQ